MSKLAKRRQLQWLIALAVILLVIAPSFMKTVALPVSGRIDCGIEDLKAVGLVIKKYEQRYNGSRPSELRELVAACAEFPGCTVETQTRLASGYYVYQPNAEGSQALLSCYLQLSKSTSVILWTDASGRVYLARVWKWPIHMVSKAIDH